jgi:CRISPR-associated protein Cas2
MSAEKRWRLICYDVRDPKRYRSLYKVMKGVGRRIQYSVFRSRLDDREIEQLRWKLATILDPVDRLLVVDLCPSCASRAISRNHVEGWTEKPPAYTIVTSQAPERAEASSDAHAENEGDSKKIGRTKEGGDLEGGK